MPPSDDVFSAVRGGATVDPYHTLGLDRRAGPEEIKRAYFQLVRQYPPEQAPEKFQEIRAAYEVLRHAASKAQIDLFLIQPPPLLPSRRRASYDLTVHSWDLGVLAAEFAAESALRGATR
jgi:curved DNA-binding protein CbpA